MTVRGLSRFLVRAAVLGGAAFSLSACEIQQGSTPETSKAGVYKGPADEKLSEGDVEALRGRGQSAFR